MRTVLFHLGVLFLSVSVGAWESNAGSSADEIAKLIKQLSDSDSRKREEASAKLEKIGEPATKQLKVAAKSKNLDTSREANRLLIAIQKGALLAHNESINKRLDAFTQDVDGSKQVSLPGWDHCQWVVGNSRRARAVFARMYRAEPELFDKLERNPDLVAKMLAARAKGWPENALNLSLDSTAAMLLVAGDPRVEQSEELTNAILGGLYSEVQLILQGPTVLNKDLMLKEPDRQIYVRLISQWVNRPIEEPGLLARFFVAGDCKLQDDELALIKKILKPMSDDDSKNEQRAHAIMTALTSIVYYPESGPHLAIVEPWLEDKTFIKYEGLDPQIRDVALRSLDMLTQDEMSERETMLGFSTNPLGQFEAYTFKDDAEREVEISRWRAWAKENLKQPVK